MKCIFGNYGNETVALIQWAQQEKLDDVYVISINTGWAAADWPTRVTLGQDFARRYGYTPIELKAVRNFPALVKQKRQFPSSKAQWCAGFLKGLTFLEWLDEEDPKAEALIILGNRWSDRNSVSNTQAKSEEYYGERKTLLPLLDMPEGTYQALLEQAGLPILNHRSLECDPCVNNSIADFQRLTKEDIEKTLILEENVGKFMFPDSLDNSSIVGVVQKAKKQKLDKSNEQFSMGCGSPFACGL